ncbi:MAG: multicopper oxidase domain-containing protein [Acidimicrobiia bacterium]|nr:multicopper oxidase domain-containing protein [Acidimicrobiia bacterium]MDH4307771.1 multicopper oxidase domain-containing protein [Acidimicrobiia bacterium]MDH5294153.1 multicopper oxidase domain-containing protein [Acidimicrobiia bacterium]
MTLLGAGAVLGSVGTHAAAHASSAAPTTDHYESERRLSSELPAGDAAGPYGGSYSPPNELDETALDAVTIPPPPNSGPVEVEMTVVETEIAVGRDNTVAAWTYNGSAPGPIIRATEGELIRIRFVNATGHDHNLHFHGRHSPIHDGWEPVPPGGEVIYEIEAGPAGVHPYHCHTMPIDLHISKGLYGTLIVDPPGGRSDAHEVVLALTGWDVNDDGRNELYTWNGVAGFFEKFPIKIPAGEPVRTYVLNLMEYEPVGSFHLHAETFTVFPAGIGSQPAFETDVITLGQMERAMIEFHLSDRGRYMFHPHQHSIAHRGATGWFSAI